MQQCFKIIIYNFTLEENLLLHLSKFTSGVKLHFKNNFLCNNAANVYVEIACKIKVCNFTLQINLLLHLSKFS